jgi:hypothetical protein
LTLELLGSPQRRLSDHTMRRLWRKRPNGHSRRHLPGIDGIPRDLPVSVPATRSPTTRILRVPGGRSVTGTRLRSRRIRRRPSGQTRGREGRRGQTIDRRRLRPGRWHCRPTDPKTDARAERPPEYRLSFAIHLRGHSPQAGRIASVPTVRSPRGGQQRGRF